VIELTEEPYDGEVAVALVAALHAEINVRYAAEIEGMTLEEIIAGDTSYLADVTAEQVRRPHGVFVVAHLDGVPVGCGALRPTPDEPGWAEIKRMYIAPEARRRGIGRAILVRLEAAAVDLGYTYLRLETGTEQPEAVAMYEAHGWHRIEPYGFYAHSPSSICFAKGLTPP
jgi:ribosomal protein S18 acetylase RimI-like enzyme